MFAGIKIFAGSNPEVLAMRLYTILLFALSFLSVLALASKKRGFSDESAVDDTVTVEAAPYHKILAAGSWGIRGISSGEIRPL